MKPSNAEWLGEIPEEWSVARIGDFYKLRNEKVSDEDYAPLSVTMKGIVPQLATAAKSDDHNNRKLVKKGDFAINSRSDRRGSCGISPYDGSVSLINTILTPRGEMNPDYYNWLFHTEQFADEFYKWGHGIVDDLWTTRWQEMKSIMIVSPPIDEQQAIANYLDDRCSKIDAIIAEAKASIEEYKELKQAVIYEAVTKGLDKNVSMKDSGIEWIGKIPKQWKIARLGRGLEFIQTGPFGSQLHSDEYIEDGIPVVNPANIKNLEIKIDNKCTLSTEKANELQQHIMTPHEIVFGRRGEMGRCACVPDDGKTYFCGTGCIRMRCNNLLYSDYLILFLSSETAKQYYELNSVGTTMSNLNSEIISATPTLYPPIDEQRNIVSHINEIVPKYDNLIIEKQSLIEDLEAYKKSLIYEVVTGKRKVVA